MNIPIERDELDKLLRELVKKVDDGDQFVYMQVTRGNGLRGHIYPENMQGNLWITLTPCHVADTYKPIDVITYEDKRFYYCNCKTLNLIPSCLAATDMVLPGTARIRLLAFAKKLGYEVEERDYTLDELMSADEIVVHSTGSFCIPVKTVDGKSVGGKAPEMLKTIQDALVSDFEEQCKA